MGGAVLGMYRIGWTYELDSLLHPEEARVAQMPWSHVVINRVVMPSDFETCVGRRLLPGTVVVVLGRARTLAFYDRLWGPSMRAAVRVNFWLGVAALVGFGLCSVLSG